MNPQKVSQSGRSMVEMLGIMAIVGVLSITGIYGYTKAMERYRANELLNEAMKRAVQVAGQLADGGDVPTTITDNEDSSKHTYTVGKNGNNQFTLGISNVDGETCELMQQMVGGAIQGITCENNSATFTFNNDLSTKNPGDNTGGSTTAGTSTVDGWTGDKPGSDCSDDTQLGGTSGCQVCVGSSYVDSDAKCESGQICLDGTCITPIGSGSGCTRNSDCKGIIGELDCDTKTCYCNYFDWDYGSVHMDENGIVPDKDSGVCMEATYHSTTAGDDGITGKLSIQEMDWFSAKNFCSALNASIISVRDSGIDESALGDYYREYEVCAGNGEAKCEGVTWSNYKGKLANVWWWTTNIDELLDDPPGARHVIVPNNTEITASYLHQFNSALCKD